MPEQRAPSLAANVKVLEGVLVKCYQVDLKPFASGPVRRMSALRAYITRLRQSESPSAHDRHIVFQEAT